MIAHPRPALRLPRSIDIRDEPQVICPRCRLVVEPLDWRCPDCHGPLELEGLPAFDPAAIIGERWSLWRYAELIPVELQVSLGEGLTPLVPTRLAGGPALAKLEFLQPTGSYKDRGTAVYINRLISAGLPPIVEDSSGNAGASLAAYASAAGARARVFVPAHAAPAKKRQISRHGAELVEVPGPRSATAAACRAAARRAIYASHVWSPWFILGHMTCAWEIWEQLGRRAPQALICPVGQGNLLLGLARGFAALLAAGAIAAVPRLFAAQADACAPLARAWELGLDEPAPVTEGPTVAEGIRSAAPVRGAEILARVRESGGAVLRVAEEAILAAQTEAAQAGLAIEPTSAVAVAAMAQARAMLPPGAEIVTILTGSGLKSV